MENDKVHRMHEIWKTKGKLITANLLIGAVFFTLIGYMAFFSFTGNPPLSETALISFITTSLTIISSLFGIELGSKKRIEDKEN